MLEVLPDAYRLLFQLSTVNCQKVKLLSSKNQLGRFSTRKRRFVGGKGEKFGIASKMLYLCIVNQKLTRSDLVRRALGAQRPRARSRRQASRPQAQPIEPPTRKRRATQRETKILCLTKKTKRKEKNYGSKQDFNVD